jgi:hypothetical protein
MSQNPLDEFPAPLTVPEPWPVAAPAEPVEAPVEAPVEEQAEDWTVEVPPWPSHVEAPAMTWPVPRRWVYDPEYDLVIHRRSCRTCRNWYDHYVCFTTFPPVSASFTRAQELRQERRQLEREECHRRQVEELKKVIEGISRELREVREEKVSPSLIRRQYYEG